MLAEQHHYRCQMTSRHSPEGQQLEIRSHDPPASMEGSIQWGTVNRNG